MEDELKALHADKEFAALSATLKEGWGLEFNLFAAGQFTSLARIMTRMGEIVEAKCPNMLEAYDNDYSDGPPDIKLAVRPTDRETLRAFDTLGRILKSVADGDATLFEVAREAASTEADRRELGDVLAFYKAAAEH
jgi:hypothetical protein